ncbi:MAG: cytochrome P450 [Trebonia sp.]
MTVVTELDLPEIDYMSPGFGPDTYHRLLAEARSESWIAHSPLAFIVLDRESGDFFLRSKATAFPGRQIAEIFGITSGRLYEHINANILNLTGDKHRRLRSLVGHAFTPRAADRWRPVMREFLRQLWDGMTKDGVAKDGTTSAEFVSAFARPYPSRTVAAVLGAPVGDAPRLFRWANMVQRQFDVQALSTQIPDIEQAAAESYDYVEDLVAARKRHPEDDLISMIAQAEEDGDRLSHDECVNLILNVIAGGIDTTQGQLSHGMLLFARHPGQWALLASAPEKLAPAATSEIVRFEPVAPITARICLEDIEHRGVTFPAGTIVAVSSERANRETGDGETFDIAAPRDGKVFTFGAGAHHCLGVNLARAEIEEALTFLAPRMPGLALDGDAELGNIEGIYGVDALPLRWTAAGQPATLPNNVDLHGVFVVTVGIVEIILAACKQMAHFSSGGAYAASQVPGGDRARSGAGTPDTPAFVAHWPVGADAHPVSEIPGPGGPGTDGGDVGQTGGHDADPPRVSQPHPRPHGPGEFAASASPVAKLRGRGLLGRRGALASRRPPRGDDHRAG